MFKAPNLPPKTSCIVLLVPAQWCGIPVVTGSAWFWREDESIVVKQGCCASDDLLILTSNLVSFKKDMVISLVSSV